jgi:hypothetical protein
MSRAIVYGEGCISKKGQTSSQGGGDEEDDRFVSTQSVIPVKPVKEGLERKAEIQHFKANNCISAEVFGDVDQTA